MDKGHPGLCVVTSLHGIFCSFQLLKSTMMCPDLAERRWNGHCSLFSYNSELCFNLLGPFRKSLKDQNISKAQQELSQNGFTSQSKHLKCVVYFENCPSLDPNHDYIHDKIANIQGTSTGCRPLNILADLKILVDTSFVLVCSLCNLRAKKYSIW